MIHIAKNVLNAALQCVGVSSRYRLDCIKAEVEGGRGRITATNGHILLEINTGEVVAGGSVNNLGIFNRKLADDWEGLIWGSDAKEIAGCIPSRKEPMSARFEDSNANKDYYVVLVPGMEDSFHIPKPEGKFPQTNYQAEKAEDITEGAEEYTITVKELLKLLTAFDKLGHEKVTVKVAAEKSRKAESWWLLNSIDGTATGVMVGCGKDK